MGGGHVSEFASKLPQRKVVLVSKKSEHDRTRWVYLAIGNFCGLAETMDESIRFAIRTPHDGDEVGLGG